MKLEECIRSLVSEKRIIINSKGTIKRMDDFLCFNDDEILDETWKYFDADLLTFEEAFEYFKKGKKIVRLEWLKFHSKTTIIYFEDLLKKDWKVID